MHLCWGLDLQHRLESQYCPYLNDLNNVSQAHINVFFNTKIAVLPIGGPSQPIQSSKYVQLLR